jgi:hypothetical protein
LHPTQIWAANPRKLSVQAALQQRLATLKDSREFEFTELADAQGSVAHCPFQWQTLGYHPPDAGDNKLRLMPVIMPWNTPFEAGLQNWVDQV